VKPKLILAVLAGLVGPGSTGFAAEAVSPNALEPCINGQVSASGLYPTQAEEDAARAEAKRERVLSNQVSARTR
jgi:hypothetical protein